MLLVIAFFLRLQYAFDFRTAEIAFFLRIIAGGNRNAEDIVQLILNFQLQIRHAVRLTEIALPAPGQTADRQHYAEDFYKVSSLSALVQWKKS